MKRARLLLAAYLVVGIVRADDDGMQGSLNLGATLTEGNSETRLIHAGLETEGPLPCGSSLQTGAALQYGESVVDGQRETTLEQATVFAHVDRDVSTRAFGALDAQALYDPIAGIDYRAVVGPSLGVHLVKNERMQASLEAGPSYLWEETDDGRDAYLVIRLLEKARVELGTGAHLWQAAELVPKVDDLDVYLLATEVGAEATMTARMSLRLVLQHRYDSSPVEGRDRNDLTLISGLRLAL